MSDDDWERVVHVVLTNETAGHSFSEFDDDYFGDEATTGDLYRAAQAEYGRCQSKVYVDTKNGDVKHVGWFFVSKQRYEDTGKPYLRGAWVTVDEVLPTRRRRAAL